MAMTPEEKHERRIQGFMERLKKKDYGGKKNDVAVAFQKYVRLAEADEYEMVICCTCGTRKHYKEMDAGHWQRRGNEGVMFWKSNVHSQCKHCNDHLSGNYGEYEKFIQANYSEDQIRLILESRKRDERYTLRELAELKIKCLDDQKVEERRIKFHGGSSYEYVYPSRLTDVES